MSNYTVKLLLRENKKNEKGQAPIYIRITIARQSVFIATGHFVLPGQWSAKTEGLKTHPNSKALNIDLIDRKNKIIRKIVDLQVAGKAVTAKGVKELFAGKDLTNLFDFIEAYALEVKHKKSDKTISVYHKVKRKLQLFHGSESLHFEEITPAFLTRLENHLRQQDLNNNYVHYIFKTLKVFFNAAIKRRLITYYPFGEYENPVYVQPVKDYLTLSEMDKWETFVDECTNEVIKQAGTYFLFGCYSGLRISDWYQFSIDEHLTEDRIRLRATKNNEWVTMPLNNRLLRTIERMKALPLTIEEPTINEKLKIIARELKINKRITSHGGRRSFAITMCADRGISSEVCASLMGISIQTCVQHYYRVTSNKIDAEIIKAWADL